MERLLLLSLLPPYRGHSMRIKSSQTVGDIMKEIGDAHKYFAKDYDTISAEFESRDRVEVLKQLFDFLKENVRYREETEGSQTSKSPAALLATATGDCKHYALFIAGVLDSLTRKGMPFDWRYRYASYSPGDAQPGHVFVVVRVKGVEYWVDPVLESFDSRKLIPEHYRDKKINAMALNRISGVMDFAVTESDYDDPTLTPALEDAIRKLLHYGVINTSGRINDSLLLSLRKKLPVNEYVDLVNARKQLQVAVVGGLFDDIWHGVKKVALSPLRNAYLSLVGINAFGMASKLLKVIQHGEDWKKVWAKWESFGGRPSALENTIFDGAKKKPILGTIGAASVGNPAVAAWVAAASSIIAAFKPLIESVLKIINQEQGIDPNIYPYGVCEDGVTPRNQDGSCGTLMPTQSGMGSFLQQNWPWLVAGAAGAYFLFKKKRA